MSTDAPSAGLSRRSLLQGAASVTVLMTLVPVAACTAGTDLSGGGSDAGDATGSELLRLGHVLADGPSGADLVAERPADLGPLTTDDDVVAAVTARDSAQRSDFAAGRTELAEGWLLSTTEASVLVAYAGSCPLPSC